jgi:hypothetical protein
MRTTEKQLNNLVKVICDITGLSNNKKQAIEKGQDKYLSLECANCYGGWRLISVGVKNGAHYGVFGGNGTENRLKAFEMAIKLNGIINGLEYNSK